MAKPPRVEQVYYYAAAPREVFAALTEPKKLARWFVEDAQVNLRKGGAFVLTWRGGYKLKGKVREVRPVQRLELSWVDRFPNGKTFKTVARFDLKKKGSGTLLSLTHKGFRTGKGWTVLYGAVQSGWAHYLTNLRSVLEHDVDLRRDLDVLS